MEKVRIGVLGAYRGGTMIEYCEKASNAKLVAVCDKYPGALENIKKNDQRRLRYVLFGF